MSEITSEVGSSVVHGESTLATDGIDDLCKIIVKKDFGFLVLGVSMS